MLEVDMVEKEKMEALSSTWHENCSSVRIVDKEHVEEFLSQIDRMSNRDNREFVKEIMKVRSFIDD